MIIVNAKFQVKEGCKEKFISKTQDLIKSSRPENGCISYDLYANTEDDNTLMMLEKWENQHALDDHMETEHFKALESAVGDLMASDVDIKVYLVD